MTAASWRSSCRLIDNKLSEVEANQLLKRAVLLKNGKVGRYYRVLSCLYEQDGLQYYILNDYLIIVVVGRRKIRGEWKLDVQELHLRYGDVRDNVLGLGWPDANKLLLPLAETDKIDFGNQAAINAMGKVENFISQYPKIRSRKNQ